MASPAPEDSIPSTPAAQDQALLATPGEDNALLQPPTPLMNLTPLQASPRDSLTPSGAALVPETEKNLEGNVVEAQPEHRKPLARRPIFWLAAAAVIVAVAVAVVLPVYFKVIKPPKNNTSLGGGENNNTQGNGTDTGGDNHEPPTKPPQELITGGDGSTVTTENGTEFTYRNPFGGFWVWDPENPYNDNAQPNSWTPPLNTTWKWGANKLYGVNIGGWFVLEPFISPALFEPYAAAGAIDEWTISTLMAADEANGGLGQLERHYDTFITEQDFAEIAGAGLNWIRLPIPWWAIDVWPGEPFLPRTCWKYILRAFQWARKYGLRVSIDLHVAPGSQNAYNHSGKKGTVAFLAGDMGFANAQRMLNYIRIFTEFISQPEYVNVVVMFGVVNEPVLGSIGRETLTSFDLEVHRIIREITGFGEGKGPYIAVGDGFGGLTTWAGQLPNVDRVAIDTHPYFAFSGSPNDDPINIPAADGLMGGIWPGRACSTWADNLNSIQTGFGVGIAGEYSNGFNDCGYYLIGPEPRTPANPDCASWDDWQSWDQATKDGLLSFALASMDALVNPFFWTWKIGDTSNGRVEAPLWSYKLGLDNGWMPKDPRNSTGKCAALGFGPGSPFNGEYLPWQTGGVGAGSVPPAVTASFPWPPVSITGAGAPSIMPQYTPTGTIVTLPPATFTASNPPGVDGWYNTGDTVPAPTPIPGCAYPNAWEVTGGALPIAGCPPVVV